MDCTYPLRPGPGGNCGHPGGASGRCWQHPIDKPLPAWSATGHRGALQAAPVEDVIGFSEDIDAPSPPLPSGRLGAALAKARQAHLLASHPLYPSLLEQNGAIRSIEQQCAEFSYIADHLSPVDPIAPQRLMDELGIAMSAASTQREHVLQLRRNAHATRGFPSDLLDSDLQRQVERLDQAMRDISALGDRLDPRSCRKIVKGATVHLLGVVDIELGRSGARRPWERGYQPLR